ncbi:MAG: amidohydrolase family protein [Bryobacteraceae bacterium]
MRTLVLAAVAASPVFAQLAIRGDTVHTLAGGPIRDGVVLIREGKIERVGPASGVPIPAGYRTLRAKVVTPGLVDAHSTLGLSGWLNQAHDQEQVERSAPMQPELRAIDAYDPRERLLEYVRGYGVTTVHTGHGPGMLISGQTMVAKTAARTADEAAIVPEAMVAVTLGDGGLAGAGKSPGTRGKAAAMIRSEFLKAQEYLAKRAKPEAGKEPVRDLHLETLGRILKGELRLLVTAHRSFDIMTALRLAREFNLKIVLDGASEAYLVLDQIKAAGVPVILHPTMLRSGGETANLSRETASRLQAAGIPFALQSSFESYVPKTRVVLFEAAVAAANGLTVEQALESITLGAARILGIDRRLGSLEAGKDADVALYDGDPFEYTSHCVGVVLNGQVVSDRPN